MLSCSRLAALAFSLSLAGACLAQNAPAAGNGAGAAAGNGAPNGGAAPAQAQQGQNPAIGPTSPSGQGQAYGGELPTKPAPSAVTQDIKLLPPTDLDGLFPERVYFAGQTASVQIRNSGGIQWQDGTRSMFALVDTSGYASNMQQKYQAYLLTDAPLEIGGKLLPAGAYGVGFQDGGGFVVMNLGGHDVFTVRYVRDDKMARPMPLQVMRNAQTGVYFLYEGRNCVAVARAGAL